MAKSKVLVGGAIAMASGAMLAGPVVAQDANPGLEVIIVTAQRRAETLQKVPVAVTALSEDFLADRQITSIQGLSGLAPNLKIQETPGNNTGAQIAIRGSVTINPTMAWEPAVAMYLDGVYIGKAQGAVFDVVDLQRVEILRGPQGTLYGRNTLAGAINLITARPTGEFGGSVKTQVGNFGLYSGRFSIDLPAVGPFKAKLSGAVTQRDGTIDVLPTPTPPAPAAGRPVNSELQSLDSKSTRAALLFDPGNGFDALYAFDYSDVDQLPRYGQLTRVAPGGIFDPSSPAYIAGLPANLYVNPDYQDHASTDGPGDEQSLTRGHTLTATWSLENVTLKSISAYRSMNNRLAEDFDGTPLPIIWAARVSGYDSFSQELQALGTAGRWSYVAGAYYFRDKGFEHNDPFGGPAIFGVVRQDNQYQFHTRSWAGFGQVDFDVTDQWKLSAGLRYTEEHKDLERYRAALTPVFAVAIPRGTRAEGTFDNWSPSLIAALQMTADVNLYAKWSRGYKSGGFNGEGTTVQTTVLPYNAEVVDAYEVGAKTEWLNHRLQLNSAVFLNKSKDMQLASFLGGATLSSAVVNAGTADIWGIELETAAQLTSDLQLRATYSYLHPEYKEFIDLNQFTGRIEDVSNDRAFPLAPKHTASASIDWTFLHTGYGSFRATVNGEYSDEYYLYPYSLSPAAKQSAVNNKGDSRVLLSARLGLAELKLSAMSVEIALWGKNLTDKKYVGTTLDLGPSLGGIRDSFFGDPRAYGAEVIAKW